MNMAIRGIDFNFGEGPADSFLNDQHPDLRADYVMANPPFNMKEWGLDRLPENDPRWTCGTPPANNANFAWLQHMLYHLAPTGSLALLLANGSMSSNTSGEGEIRKQLIEHDLVECMVALPGQLFTNTQIPACIWFLTKNKSGAPPSSRSDEGGVGGGRSGDSRSDEGGAGGGRSRNRKNEFLFIDARQKGYMKDRVLRDFTEEDITSITETFHRWQNGGPYEDVPGFCKAETLEGARKHDYVLTPGRYVGAGATVDDGEPFAEKMNRLTKTLSEQFAESARLEEEIKKNLAGLGWTI
jgi:type I restriction enzyme M protein